MRLVDAPSLMGVRLRIQLSGLPVGTKAGSLFLHSGVFLCLCIGSY